MTEFPIRRVDRAHAQAVETLGSKPKFWFRHDDRRFLFKADDRDTGEDWAEVIACHLCRLLGLPHVAYELAVEYDGQQEGRPGVVCENMAPPPLTLVLGNQLLLALDPDYPLRQRFKLRQHTVDAVGDALERLGPPSQEWMPDVPPGIESAMDCFVGYVLLDAWIANQDRHHENWGALLGEVDIRLAPTFDHGAALARNLLDSEREERLATRDRNRSIAHFATRGRSAFFQSPADRRPLELRSAFLKFASRVPTAADAWLRRLSALQADAVWGILEKVPESRMSHVCKQFTMELLLTNQQRLLEAS